MTKIEKYKIALLITILVFISGISIIAYQHTNPLCSSIFGEDLLPNTDFSNDVDDDGIPDGWNAIVKGPAHLADVGDFTVTNEGRSFQLLGIGNALYSPTINTASRKNYCVVSQALADQAPIPTKIQIRFYWFDRTHTKIAENMTLWQTVKTPLGGGWSLLKASFTAPKDAAFLQVGFYPASDDRIYLDEIHLYQGGLPKNKGSSFRTTSFDAPYVSMWPYGKDAAVSFSFDWETAMGGLIHSRSVNDIYGDQDPILRGYRMRQGITETLEIFRPYNIRATYYATGYNFLRGNHEKRIFMNDPIYQWATPANGWKSDWSKVRWFGRDPYIDYQTRNGGAAWYFGDLIPILRLANQDIQSHTFSHFYGGFVTPNDWSDDFEAWNNVTATNSVAPALSLAFPWSGSGGMSYGSWDVLANNGIRSVTRMSHRPQYSLFKYKDDVPVEPRCIPIPGHESMLACPDVYLTPGKREKNALDSIEAAILSNGAVDIWSHTEEVTSFSQIETWKRVVKYTANNKRLWIAPLREITQRQQEIKFVHVEVIDKHINNQANEVYYEVKVANQGDNYIDGITLNVPGTIKEFNFAGKKNDNRQISMLEPNKITLSLDSKQNAILYIVSEE